VGAATASLTKGSGRPAKNAAFTVVKGKIKITASQVGLGPDLASLADDLARACVGAGARTAAVKFTQTQPSLTTTAAREMGISDRISSFTTTYATVNPARTSNVHLLAHALDAKLVPPGGTFSFNQTAGERTAAKGYQEAPAIVKGKLVPQLGGGVCQVGTTFFNTVFFSGLPIVERHNHSFFISHYPKGRDATVSWGGPDFKFKNDTKGWILIRTSTTASSITISLYGTDPGYQVDYTTGPFTDVVPHKVIEVKDPKLKKGARIVTDGGVDGCRILVVRTVYKDGAVVRTDRFVSIYSPKDETVRVGTKTASTTPTSTPTP
jgi:vancomycin resistance protein YoaR